MQAAPEPSRLITTVLDGMERDPTVVKQVLYQAPPAWPIALSVKLSRLHRLGIGHTRRNRHTTTQPTSKLLISLNSRLLSRSTLRSLPQIIGVPFIQQTARSIMTDRIPAQTVRNDCNTPPAKKNRSTLNRHRQVQAQYRQRNRLRRGHHGGHLSIRGSTKHISLTPIQFSLLAERRRTALERALERKTHCADLRSELMTP
jgi:hypothetical protein